ncbi:MAG: 30S ribosomal protein S1 [Candidatus Moranbacteria bacterium CG_4_10_14_3_um_filter_44_15]|nr:MAG: 30S ribosomal protein S1 [Candidatus Moranbacteria bacterium CG_4_8_14_3_um_filter_43_15]PIX90528.1 MAG: 30S ribosomal protein S1 [Candidatus Moranbacteria bacterium CG_4_10_14_3_um_filter_44_15]PJA85844.1 MAG: 30S ribosomal protein S1 [Candidatus Moranbacteria bacterium CG_4_9_14_3_um_filter_44_28]
MQNDIYDALAQEVDKISEEKSEVAIAKQEEISAKTEEKAPEPISQTSAMADFLNQQKITLPKEGDVIKGEVIAIDSSAIYLDLGNFGTGIVMGREIKDGLGTTDKLKIGDKVSATVTDLENEDGYVELSIREASIERAWQDIEEKQVRQEPLTTKILDANKGGLIVEMNGISGFLPVSQLTNEHYPRVEEGEKSKILEKLRAFIGTEMKVCVIDTDREGQKLIVSEKAAYSKEEKKAISELKIEDVIEGEVSGVVDFGAFVKFLPPSKKNSQNEEDKLEGLVHISELAWQLIGNPREVVKTEDRVKCQIIGIDDTRVSLSIKALQKDPWSAVEKKYKAGEIYDGQVRKINHFGAFVYLDDDIHGLAHVSELLEQNPGKNIEDILEVGKSYKWKILSIEPKEHRMGLGLVKQA